MRQNFVSNILNLVGEKLGVIKTAELKQKQGIKELIEEVFFKKADRDVRFDTTGRVEVWVTSNEIKEHKDYKKIVDSDKSDEEKIKELKELAVDIAYDKVQSVSKNGVDITVELIEQDINIDRIDWDSLVKKEDKEMTEQSSIKFLFKKKTNIALSDFCKKAEFDVDKWKSEHPGINPNMNDVLGTNYEFLNSAFLELQFLPKGVAVINVEPYDENFKEDWYRKIIKFLKDNEQVILSSLPGVDYVEINAFGYTKVGEVDFYSNNVKTAGWVPVKSIYQLELGAHVKKDGLAGWVEDIQEDGKVRIHFVDPEHVEILDPTTLWVFQGKVAFIYTWCGTLVKNLPESLRNKLPQLKETTGEEKFEVELQRDRSYKITLNGKELDFVKKEDPAWEDLNNWVLMKNMKIRDEIFSDELWSKVAYYIDKNLIHGMQSVTRVYEGFLVPAAQYVLTKIINEDKPQILCNGKFDKQADLVDIPVDVDKICPVVNHVLAIYSDSIITGNEHYGDFIVSCFAPTRKEASTWISNFERRLVKENQYIGKSLYIENGKINFCNIPKVIWDDIVLDDKVKNDIRINTVSFLSDERLKNTGVMKRGLIIYGPPGTGKTSIIKAIFNELDDRNISRIYVTAESFSKMSVKNLFDFIPYLGKVVLAFEDVDMIGRSRETPFSNNLLGDLLTNLDGMRAYDEQIVVIASTNKIEMLDNALANRPCRFDRRIEIKLPSEKDLRNLYEKFSGINLPEEVIKISAGFTGAHVVEAVNTAKILSAYNNKPLYECMIDACNIIRNNFFPMQTQAEIRKAALESLRKIGLKIEEEVEKEMESEKDKEKTEKEDEEEKQDVVNIILKNVDTGGGNIKIKPKIKKKPEDEEDEQKNKETSEKSSEAENTKENVTKNAAREDLKEEQSEKDISRPIKEFDRVRLLLDDVKGTVIDINLSKPGDVDYVIYVDKLVHGQDLVEAHPTEIKLLDEPATDEQIDKAKKRKKLYEKEKKKYEKDFKKEIKEDFREEVKEDFKKEIKEEVEENLKEENRNEEDLKEETEENLNKNYNESENNNEPIKRITFLDALLKNNRINKTEQLSIKEEKNTPYMIDIKDSVGRPMRFYVGDKIKIKSTEKASIAQEDLGYRTWIIDKILSNDWIEIVDEKRTMRDLIKADYLKDEIKAGRIIRAALKDYNLQEEFKEGDRVRLIHTIGVRLQKEMVGTVTKVPIDPRDNKLEVKFDKIPVQKFKVPVEHLEKVERYSKIAFTRPYAVVFVDRNDEIRRLKISGKSKEEIEQKIKTLDNETYGLPCKEIISIEDIGPEERIKSRANKILTQDEEKIAKYESETKIAEETSYKQKIKKFVDFPWQEDTEIEFVQLIKEYLEKYSQASDATWQDYLKRLYETNKSSMVQLVSDEFLRQLEKLIYGEDIKKSEREITALGKKSQVDDTELSVILPLKVGQLGTVERRIKELKELGKTWLEVRDIIIEEFGEYRVAETSTDLGTKKEVYKYMNASELEEYKDFYDSLPEPEDVS